MGIIRLMSMSSESDKPQLGLVVRSKSLVLRDPERYRKIRRRLLIRSLICDLSGRQKPNDIIRSTIEKRDPGTRYHGADVFHSNASLSELVCLTAVTGTAAEIGTRQKLITGFKDLDPIRKIHPWRGLTTEGDGVNILRAMKYWDGGGGHITQRIQRMVGLPIDAIPRGRLVNPKVMQRNLVVVHSSIVTWAHHCPQDLHVWPVQQLQALIAERKDLEFVQIGPRDAGRGCEHVPSDLAGYIDMIGWCGTFIGLPSGLMHLAAAFRKPSIIIYEEPHPNGFSLPAGRKNLSDRLMWYYPQNIHIHAHIPNMAGQRLTSQFLSDCIDGKVVQPSHGVARCLDLNRA